MSDVPFALADATLDAAAVAASEAGYSEAATMLTGIDAAASGRDAADSRYR